MNVWTGWCSGPSSRRRDVSLQNRTVWRSVGVKGSSASLEFILWGPWMLITHFMVIYPTSVEMFLSEPQIWAEQSCSSTVWLCAVWCLAVFQCFHASHRLHDRRRILSSHQSLYIYSWFKLIDAVRLLTHQANFKIQTGWLIKHFLSPHITRRLQLRVALERITKTTCDGELTADSLSYSVFVVQRCWEDSVLLKDKLNCRFHNTCFCCAARQLNRTSVLHISGWSVTDTCHCSCSRFIFFIYS